MSTPVQLRSQAKQFQQAKKFSEALPLWKELWESNKNNCNEWDGWSYAFCLKQLKEFKPALDICREVFKSHPDFENIKSLYAWCIYYTEIAIPKIENETIFFKAGEGIIKLSKQEDKSVKKTPDFPCVYSLSIFKILVYLNEKAIVNHEKILYWTEKLNPDLLEATPFKFTGNDGKERELAPQKEQWFTLRSKAFYELSKYNECIQISEQALGLFQKFHYDNDIWLKRNIALSKAGLGDSDSAISELNALLKRKNEWFIQKEIAEIHKKQNRIDDALKYAVDAALNFGDMDKKLNLFKLLSELLKSKGLIDEAKPHILLMFHIRSTNQWRIDSDLTDSLREYNIDTNKVIDVKDLQRQLKTIWEKLKFGTQELQKGIIRNLISEGRAGFIDTADQKSYFFSTKNFIGKKDLIKPGQKVSFFLEDSFDKKKNQPNKIAINVKPIY